MSEYERQSETPHYSQNLVDDHLHWGDVVVIAFIVVIAIAAFKFAG